MTSGRECLYGNPHPENLLRGINLLLTSQKGAWLEDLPKTRQRFHTLKSFTHHLESSSPRCSPPVKGMASVPTDASNGRGASKHHHTQAAQSSPHGVRDLRGGKHRQPPGGPVLFERQGQHQGSFGVGIICGQCNKGLILIQRGEKQHSLQSPTSKEPPQDPSQPIIW